MINLISWNVNGIRAVIKKGEFAKLIQTYHPDILCLQEIKANKEQVEIDLAGYHAYWNSADKKGYSGTAIFSKVKPLSVSYDFTIALAKKYHLTDTQDRDSSTEGRVISAEFQKFYVVTAYTPNSKDDLSRLELRHQHWDPAFLEHCKELEKHKPVLVCGDFNVAYSEDDLARPKANIGKHGFTDEERAGFQAFLDAGFIDTFRIFHKGNGHYTWWSHWGNARANNVGWRIDYWLSSKVLKPSIKKADIFADQLGSDHCPVALTIDDLR